MFVVQLTNTNLNGDSHHKSNTLIFVQNSILVVSLIVLLTIAYSILDDNLLLSISNLNLTETLMNSNNTLISGLESYIDHSIHGNNLSLLASSIFNEYGYVLVVSVHAIILAVIGPIKLALADLPSS
jgi:NADH:ubiquinone oxidoreductase subunit 6 (subunit J)